MPKKGWEMWQGAGAVDPISPPALCRVLSVSHPSPTGASGADLPEVNAKGPDHMGTGLVNLVAEIEGRLTGTAPARRLTPHLAATIPQASSIVLVLFDGLGDTQLAH